MLDVAARRWLAASIDVAAMLFAAIGSFGLIYAMVVRYRIATLSFAYTIAFSMAAAYSLIELVVNASPGKLAARLQITGANGQRPRRTQSITRWLLKALPLLIALLWVILDIPRLVPPFLAALIASITACVTVGDYLSILRDHAQPLHDQLTRTDVRAKPRREPHGFPVSVVRKPPA